MNINWRRFIMVDSPYRWITFGVWRDEVAVSVSCLQLPPACCARAASGHAAAPPSNLMKWRRFIQ
jgi:hypothetical protein